MKRGKSKVFLVILIIIIILAGIFYFVFHAKTCKNEDCFLNALRDCKRAKYTINKEGNIWQYEIKNPFGFWKGTCIVKVKNIKVVSEESMQIQGKSMQCAIPKDYAGTYMEIHQKLEYCSGPLKESLQDILIDKLYKYVVQHIGEITEEIKR
ncbi:hypothetical protein B6U80_02370 [Candidatus Pacearchaeota archaeon ex4484_26]|nr:MAG: hypothetical protein B6U80_02370 [Candidatus Pacearchaeota archaeon ex4484_26]